MKTTHTDGLWCGVFQHRWLMQPLSVAGWFPIYLLWLILSLGLMGTVHAATYTVTKIADTNDGACDSDCSLREAVTAVNGAGVGTHTITIPAGTYTITLGGSEADNVGDNTIRDFDFTSVNAQTVIINGAGSGSTIIQGMTNVNIFQEMGSVGAIEFNDMTIRGSGTATSLGGCIYTNGATLTINRTILESCATSNSGGAVYSGPTVALVTLVDITLQNNSSGGSGGGMAVNGFSVTRSTFISNSSAATGGAIYNVGAAGNFYGANTFTGNHANGSASNAGGCIYTNQALTINDAGSIFSGNYGGGSGGCIWISSTLNINDSTVFDGNYTTTANGGGAIIANTGIITNVTFINNHAIDFGGALYPLSTFTINNGTFENNYLDATATTGGGAIYLKNAVYTVTINNSTFSGNNAGGGQGGAINTYNNASTYAKAYNSTFYNNTASGTTQALYAGSSGRIQLFNSIVSHPSTNANLCNSTGAAGNDNVEYNNTGTACTAVTGRITTDPLLSTLAYNGGPTKTMALQAGSSAIDASGTSATGSDQRGVTAVGTRDVGAYESGGSVSSTSISGTVYSDEGITTVAAGKVVRLIKDGVNAASTTTDSSGNYSITTTLSSNSVLIYIDNDATVKGNTVTSSGTSSISGVDIYADRVITRHDNSASLTNALMNTALGSYSDSDILYSVTGGNLTNSGASTELFVWSGHTFAPGGTITTTHMDINGTLDAAANAINVAGNWDATGGIFTSTGTVTFNATSGTNTIIPGGVDANHDFQNVIFNDAAGSATFQLGGAIKVNGDFTVTDGIFDTSTSNYAVTVSGAFNQTGGRISGNSSTFTVAGNFVANGSESATGFNNASLVINGTGSTITYNNVTSWWTDGFNSLTVGQAGVTDTLTTWLAVRNMLTIGTGTLSGAATTLALTAAGTSTTFDAASNLNIGTLMFIKFGGTQNIVPLTNGYNCNISVGGGSSLTVAQTGNIMLNAGKSLQITGDNQASRALTYDTAGFNLTVGGNITLGAGSDSATKTLNITNSAVSVAGNFTISSGTNTLTATGSTVTFNNNSILGDTSTGGPQQFNNVVLNGTSLTLGSSAKMNNLTITAGTMDLGSSSYTLEITGTGTPLSNSGTFTAGTSTVKYSGTTTATNITALPYSSLQLAPTASTTYSLTGHLTGGNALTGSLTIGANATLDTTASNYNITLAGNWSNSGGYTANSSTVTLNAANGVAQAINGSTTFYNLTKSVTGASTLTFEATKTTTINGTVTLNGASGQLLTLTSSTGSSVWGFVVNSGATKAISYVSVSWSDASGSHASQKPIAPSNSTDGGNNTDWFAAASPSISVLKSSTLISDPVNGATSPLHIPGAIISYQIQTTNSGSGSPDANSVIVIDGLDSTTLEYDVATGVTFTPNTSGLTLGSVSYSHTSTPTTYTYTPTGPYDPNVAGIKVTTTGTFATGGANFTISFKIRVK